jgi:hypothetical protein
MINKHTVIDLIASLEVPLMDSDDPEIRYWQGFHDAQVAITDLIQNANREEIG